MKTLQEMYDEIMASDDEKRAFVEAVKSDSVADFLKQHGCDAAEEDLQEFLDGKAADDAPLELSIEELKSVAGGTESVISSPCSNTCGDTCGCSDTCIRDCC